MKEFLKVWAQVALMVTSLVISLGIIVSIAYLTVTYPYIGIPIGFLAFTILVTIGVINEINGGF